MLRVLATVTVVLQNALHIRRRKAPEVLTHHMLFLERREASAAQTALSERSTAS